MSSSDNDKIKAKTYTKKNYGLKEQWQILLLCCCNHFIVKIRESSKNVFDQSLTKTDYKLTQTQF